MKKRFITAIIAIALVLISAVGTAAVRLSDYTVIVNGRTVNLSGNTGYVYRQNSVLLAPIEVIASNLGYICEYDKSNRVLKIEKPGGKAVTLRVGSKVASGDDGKSLLRYKTVLQSGGFVTCDARVIKSLGVEFRNYSASVARPAGYGSGVLVIDESGDVTLPPIKTDVLPTELSDAAQSSNQIVGVKYSPDTGKAKLTLYEKSGRIWHEQYSSEAYVGSNGIGKTREGDKKTPSGTYNLTKPFGIKPDPGCRMGGYTQVNKYHYWCSTSGSRFYNRLVDISEVSYSPTDADERLISYAPYYNYALFIDYNASGVAGRGSAIFLHCKGSAETTSGCVAVEQPVMRSLLMTLTDGAKIVIY